ncbi:MAG: methyl-accepting chemotaxis protein, partial [Puniceicoccales bacterium]|nr:methyl-accepting chemotaxis protein [Puniceicoccales bacterium]
MWAKIFEYFLNLKIKRKLILFSSFYVGLVLLLLSATTLSWNAVENGHRQQESAYQIVRSVQSARIAEKSYLKYYQPMYERELVSNCIDILSLSRTLEGRIDRSKTSHIDRDIQLYRKIFGDVVRGYQKLFKTQKDIHECMDRVSSKIKRLDEISTEFSTREWIKDRYHNMAEWSSLYDRFLTEWNDEYLGIFAAYVESVLTPDLSKTLATLAEQKSELWFILQPIREGFDLFGTIPDTAQTAFSFTQTNANKMDEIGIQISLNADILLAESKSIILSIKTRMMWFMGYVGGAGCLLAVLAGVLLNQLISKSLNNVVEATRTLADGDLTTRVPVESQDEIGQMALQFNTFVERLQQIIRQIDENANLLSSSSTDLTDTSNRLTGSIEKMNLRASTVVKAGGELSTNIEFMAKSSEG